MSRKPRKFVVKSGRPLDRKKETVLKKMFEQTRKNSTRPYVINPRVGETAETMKIIEKRRFKKHEKKKSLSTHLFEPMWPETQQRRTKLRSQRSSSFSLPLLSCTYHTKKLQIYTLQNKNRELKKNKQSKRTRTVLNCSRVKITSSLCVYPRFTPRSKNNRTSQIFS